MPGYNFSEASGAARSLSLPIPPKHFVHAEREICAHSEEQRAPRRRKNGQVEGRLHSQGRGHRQSKGGQKSSAQQSNDASVPTERARRRPKSVSAPVAIIANAGIIAAGKNQLSGAV
jgi:hypothetical protein